MAKTIQTPTSGNKFPVQTVYGLWAHTPCVRRDFEKHVLVALQKKAPVRKLNVFMEMVCSAKDKRAHESTLASTQAESLRAVESWADSLQNENYLTGVPVLLLRRIKEQFGCAVNPRFIDINSEDANFATVKREDFFRQFPRLISDALIYKYDDGSWGVQAIENLGERGYAHGEMENQGRSPSLAAMGGIAEQMSARLVEALVESNRLRHARIHQDLEGMPKFGEAPGEVNLVLYGASHVEVTRRAAKNQAERLVVLAPDAFLNRIPERYRKTHSILQYSFSHNLRLRNQPMTQTHCRRLFLDLALKGAIQGLANHTRRYFSVADADLFAESSVDFLVSQMARTFTPEEVDHLWAQLFPAQADFDGFRENHFDVKRFWEPTWLAWMTENYYPGGKDLIASGQAVGLDPRRFPEMFNAMVHEHFWRRKGPADL